MTQYGIIPPTITPCTLQARHFHSSRPSLEPKDPYQVLGIKKDATAAEIKKVYFSVRLYDCVAYCTP